MVPCNIETIVPILRHVQARGVKLDNSTQVRWRLSGFTSLLHALWHTVDGSEIRDSPVEVGSLSHNLLGFIHAGWCRISSINSMALVIHTSQWFHLYLRSAGIKYVSRSVSLKGSLRNSGLEDMAATFPQFGRHERTQGDVPCLAIKSTWKKQRNFVVTHHPLTTVQRKTAQEVPCALLPAFEEGQEFKNSWQALMCLLKSLMQWRCPIFWLITVAC